MRCGGGDGSRDSWAGDGGAVTYAIGLGRNDNGGGGKTGPVDFGDAVVP
jgi:hypothetical protein